MPFQIHRLSFLLLTFVHISQQQSENSITGFLTIKKPIQRIGAQCINDHYCSQHAYCSPTSHACACFMGYIPHNNKFDCTPIECGHSYDECRLLVDPNSECQQTRCMCKLGYELNQDKKCVKRAIYLGEPCSENDACGTRTRCFESKCACAHGHIPKNIQNCRPIDCTVDDQCVEAKFGANATCNDGECACADGFTWTEMIAGDWACVDARLRERFDSAAAKTCLSVIFIAAQIVLSIIIIML